jgi:DNA-binding beta-propeller fold protein YncE
MPYKLGVDDSGYVYVADLGNHRVQKFTSDGTFVAKFGSYGSDDGELTFPSGVALGDSGCVYTCEHVLNRIQKFEWSCPE